jgi:serine O-acetyltransferase
MVARQKRSLAGKTAAVLANRGFQAVLAFRLSHAFWKWRMPLVPLVLSRFAQHVFAVDIDYRAQIGPGFVLVHCFGIVVGNSTRIGKNCCLYHGVTLGNKGNEWVGSMEEDGQPTVGDRCILGAGAKVLGKVVIGRNCVIGANSVVLQDVPADRVAAGMPAKVVSVRPEMDENLHAVSGRHIALARQAAELAK